MQFVVAASEEQWLDLTVNRPGINWLRVDDATAFALHKNATAFFNLKEEGNLEDYHAVQQPVMINSVVQTISNLQVPANVYRINGWAGFLSRPVWEIAGLENESIKSIFNKADLKINFVKDEPGFVTARIIAMIINEAYFAVEDAVSTKSEINTAMKLGTNYPYGPFEWAGLIGIKNILTLLDKLCENDTRYKPSALLIKENKDQES